MESLSIDPRKLLGFKMLAACESANDKMLRNGDADLGEKLGAKMGGEKSEAKIGGKVGDVKEEVAAGD